MSDDFGNFVEAAAPYAAGGYAAYKTYNRYEPFIKGASAAIQGGQLGAMVAKAGGSQVAKAAVAGTVAKVAAGSAARAGAGLAAGAASGASAGAAAGSVVPGLGTAIGAVVGAVAPLVISQTPLAAPIRKIPVLGGILAPNLGGGKKTKFVPAADDRSSANSNLTAPGSGGGNLSSAPAGGGNLSSPGNFAAQNRAEYEAGRGFRKK